MDKSAVSQGPAHLVFCKQCYFLVIILVAMEKRHMFLNKGVG